jgi:hypothetical protein
LRLSIWDGPTAIISSGPTLYESSHLGSSHLAGCGCF